MQKKPKILISRTDSIGDVILTIPLAGIIKKQMPNAEIIFLGRDYTRDVVATSGYINQFISLDDINKLSSQEQISYIKNLNLSHCIHVFPKKEIAILMKKANVPVRVGTTNRVFHWGRCNKLIKLSRKKSDLHEAQLNCVLLKGIGISITPSLKEIPSFYGMTATSELKLENQVLLAKEKKNIIIHAKSQGSAVEWGLNNFTKIIKQLDKNKFNIFITGTIKERELLQPLITNCPEAIDVTGKFNLQEFVSFISQCDALIAASTGPLHISAALGKKAIGLFVDKRPIHPGRWAPLGKDAHVVIMNNEVKNETDSIIKLLNE